MRPVRAFANEDIYFFVKRIDNSRVVRAADPQARGMCWKMIGSVVAAAVLLIGVLLPSAYSLLAGYQIQSLRRKRSGWRRAGVARTAGSEAAFAGAHGGAGARRSSSSIRAPQKVVYLDARMAVSLAMNQQAVTADRAERNGHAGNSHPPGGFSGCCGCCSLWAGVIFGRLVWLQVIHHDDLLQLARTAAAEDRGDCSRCAGPIFDRTGQPLAKTLPAESVCVNPQKIPDPGMAADLLSRVLDLDRPTLYQRASTHARLRGSGFMWVKRKISRGRSRARAQPEAGLRGIPPGDAALLSARAAGVACAGVHRHRRSATTRRARQRRRRDELRRRSGGRPGLARVYNRRPAESLTIRWWRGSRSRARISR